MVEVCEFYPSGAATYLVEDIDVQITLGQYLLEPAAIDRQGLYSFDIGGFDLTEVLERGRDCGLADLVLIGGLGQAVLVCFSQHVDYLLFIESALSLGILGGRGPYS